MLDKSIKIIKDGRFLVATMPNGDVIPMQTGMIIKNDMSDRGTVYVELKLSAYILLEDFEIIDKIQKNDSIQD